MGLKQGAERRQRVDRTPDTGLRCYEEAANKESREGPMVQLRRRRLPPAASISSRVSKGADP